MEKAQGAKLLGRSRAGIPRFLAAGARWLILLRGPQGLLKSLPNCSREDFGTRTLCMCRFPKPRKMNSLVKRPRKLLL